MELLGLHHVALIAADLERSRRFYVGLLGLRVVAENYRAARRSWKVDLEGPGGLRLELFTFPDAPPRPSRPEAQGLRHLAFATADVEACRRRLAEGGVECEPVRVDEYTGRRFFFCADPDGLPIEFYEVPRA
ncbi:VOC family protein [Aquabacterium sp. A7-Y]|uniref:SMU1112c/YaeR family gloxylase I-like metalloprotein n=1 Tax=Aquabacterium sp. A7-Y TaxID=1349605 RepID=UPI00223E0A0E|nr:VOC family protein [Aquabacterium sp. A7-Y]MCW7539934.1 VOC family protein [Aquabacterium sp. A7-Y]